jgi:hypothetical protein
VLEPGLPRPHMEGAVIMLIVTSMLLVAMGQLCYGIMVINQAGKVYLISKSRLLLKITSGNASCVTNYVYDSPGGKTSQRLFGCQLEPTFTVYRNTTSMTACKPLCSIIACYMLY